MPTASTRSLMFWAPILLIAGIAIAMLFRPVAVPVDLVTIERGAISVTITNSTAAFSSPGQEAQRAGVLALYREHARAAVTASDGAAMKGLRRRNLMSDEL